jgi:hypothetical protein
VPWYEFWKRNTDDPLMKIFIEKYKFHLLPVPRDDLSICDLYVHNAERGVSAPGSIVDFLEPNYEIPPVRNGTMSDVTGLASRNTSAGVVIGLLEGFLGAFGIGNIIQQIRVGYENMDVRYLKFRFSQIKHESVNVVKAAKNLINHKIIENHPLYSPENKYYLVTALARTSSISIVAEDANYRTIDVDLRALQLTEPSMNLTIARTGYGELTYSGESNLVFGVELHQLTYYPDRKNFRMDPLNRFVGLKGAEFKEDIRRAEFIGDPKEGNVFWEVARANA